MTTKELTAYIEALNLKNDFDLAWQWVGSTDTPEVRIYEQAEGHDLVYGFMPTIQDKIRDALPEWGLEDV